MQRFSLILVFWQRVIHCGVSDDMPRGERKRIILLNGMTVITVLTILILIILGPLGEFLLNGRIEATFYPAITIGVTSFVIAPCLVLNQKGHYLAACYLFLGIWWIVVTSMSITLGGTIRIDVYFLPLTLLPLLIFKQRRHIFIGASVAILLNVACQISYHFFDPIITTPPPFSYYRQAMHFFVMMCFIFSEVFYFRVQNEKNEALIKKAQKRLEKANEKALQMARTDFLTGLDNRRAFFDKAQNVKASAVRHSDPISMIMVDIDHFKGINDTYGHAGGDVVLAALADSFQGLIRESDVLARIGGEEFAILLPRTNEEEALILAERICQAAEAMKVDFEDGCIRITISLGVACIREAGINIDDLTAQADLALYQAKNMGRNQVAVAPTQD